MIGSADVEKKSNGNGNSAAKELPLEVQTHSIIQASHFILFFGKSLAKLYFRLQYEWECIWNVFEHLHLLVSNK